MIIHSNGWTLYIYDVNMLILFPKVDCLSLEHLLRKDTGGESVGFWFFYLTQQIWHKNILMYNNKTSKIEGIYITSVELETLIEIG